MIKVQIKCPSCSETGIIKIPPDTINSTSRGLIAVNIAKDIICSHTFIAYIDKNFKVRDYFITDFQIELPQITPAERIKDTKIPRKEIVDLDLIKLNIHATLLAYILKSIFLKHKIVIIEDQEFLHNHIKHFFKYITQNTFDTNIIILTEEMYKSNKKKYRDSMVFENTNILRNMKKIINPKKLFIEKQIITRFITEHDLGYSYILLKNEILKAFELSKTIVDFVNESKEKKEKINSLKISKQLEEIYGIKINRYYLSFLIEVVKNYFGITVPTIRDSFLNSI